MTLIALTLAAALQTTPTVVEAMQPSRTDEPRTVCRREVITGSNKRVKVCRSQAAIDNDAFNAKRYLDRRLQNGARTRSIEGRGHVRTGDAKG